MIGAIQSVLGAMISIASIVLFIWMMKVHAEMTGGDGYTQAREAAFMWLAFFILLGGNLVIWWLL